MIDPDWTSLLPPVLAIVLAIWTKQVYLSLAGGLWLAWTMLSEWNPLSGIAASIQGAVDVLGSDAQVILFTLVIGALIATVEASGGVRGFVRLSSRISQFWWLVRSHVLFLTGIKVPVRSSRTLSTRLLLQSAY